MRRTVSELDTLLEELASTHAGSAIGSSGVRESLPASERRKLNEIPNVRVPPDLIELYSLCNGIDIPDIDNGYFVHPINTIVRGVANGEPTRVGGDGPAEILVFGSDGGGGGFAICTDGDPEILYLPSDGAVRGGIFDPRLAPVEHWAASLEGFLRQLADRVKECIRDGSWRVGDASDDPEAGDEWKH